MSVHHIFRRIDYKNESIACTIALVEYIHCIRYKITCYYLLCLCQVWFQNRRSKERRMKQLSALGARRQFFRNPRRLRALRPGEELDGEMMQAGFSYFGGEFYFVHNWTKHNWTKHIGTKYNGIKHIGTKHIGTKYTGPYTIGPNTSEPNTSTKHYDGSLSPNHLSVVLSDLVHQNISIFGVRSIWVYQTHIRTYLLKFEINPYICVCPENTLCIAACYKWSNDRDI